MLGGLLQKMGGGSPASTAAAKEELLEAVAPLKRGLTATEEDKARIDKLASALERRNPTKKPLASDLINGQWELLYTTSDSILGKSKPALLRPTGPIYQIIDAVALKARNKEGPPLFNEVSAELIPQSASKVKVQFKEFKILGLIPVKAPASAAGELDITYLDDELRISRGNRNNLFVLRMRNRNVKP
ncbi:hypothetical protein ABPG77_011466 [Micractinium sp. CCAP 211/92]